MSNKIKTNDLKMEKDFKKSWVECEKIKMVQIIIDYTNLWKHEDKTQLALFYQFLINAKSSDYISLLEFNTVRETNKMIITFKHHKDEDRNRMTIDLIMGNANDNITIISQTVINVVSIFDTSIYTDYDYELDYFIIALD